jgi:Anti-sigma-K factor rskA
MAPWPTQRLSSASDTPGIPERAPGGLRRRVLSTVRDDTESNGRARRDRRRMRIAGTIVCAALLLSATLALVVVASNGGGHGRPGRVDASARVARIALRRTGDRGELAMSGMSEPPVGEVYEVWLDRPNRAPLPTDALFTVTSAGSATVEIPGSLRGVRAVMVTAEPLGGSASPTGPVLLRVNLTG